LAIEKSFDLFSLPKRSLIRDPKEKSAVVEVVFRSATGAALLFREPIR
jgi:hypothetical protein